MDQELDLRVLGVDKGRIREHSSLPGTWIVPFRLSARPDESWVRNFNEVCKKNVSLEKKKAHIVGDCIEVNVAHADNQQQVLDMLKTDIASTNVACKELYEQKMKMQSDLRVLQKSQADTLQKIKDDVENLRF